MPIDLEELERRLQIRGKAAWNGTEIGRLRMSADIADSVPALIAEVRRLRAEVERRPDISPEDASSYLDWTAYGPDERAAFLRIDAALRAHAAKARKEGE